MKKNIYLERYFIAIVCAVAMMGIPFSDAEATFVGDLVFCDANNNGVFDPGDENPGEVGLNGVQVALTCRVSESNAVCFAGTEETGDRDGIADTPDLELLPDLCSDGPLTWDPTGDVTGRYLFEIREPVGSYPGCGSDVRPVVCQVTVTEGLPNNCNVLSIPRVTAMEDMPARPVNNNGDQDFCDIQAGFIPPDDGPFPEGQPLGNTARWGGCESYPDPAPGDGTYTVIIDPREDECGIYNDFGFNFRSTAATIGSVELFVSTVADYLTAVGADQPDAAALLGLLQVWDPEAAAAVAHADAETILAALTDYLDPDGDGQFAVFRWETLEQRGTMGFYVERRNQHGVWATVHDDMLPALIAAPLGGEYMLADPGAHSGKKYQYRLKEQEATGNTRSYGPFMLEMR